MNHCIALELSLVNKVYENKDAMANKQAICVFLLNNLDCNPCDGNLIFVTFLKS